LDDSIAETFVSTAASWCLRRALFSIELVLNEPIEGNFLPNT
jgi:hypothetical protein